MIHIGFLAFRAPHQGLESSSCFWMAWPGPGSKEHLLHSVATSINTTLIGVSRRHIGTSFSSGMHGARGPADPRSCQVRDAAEALDAAAPVQLGVVLDPPFEELLREGQKGVCVCVYIYIYTYTHTLYYTCILAITIIIVNIFTLAKGGVTDHAFLHRFQALQGSIHFGTAKKHVSWNWPAGVMLGTPLVQTPAWPAPTCCQSTVTSHNLRSHNFKSRVSNPTSKYIEN